MNDHLDEVIGMLAAAPTDRALDLLELELARDIRLQRREARMTAALAPVGAAAVGLALVFGLTVGGVTAVAATGPQGLDGLSGAGQLAPSALLEGGR